MSTSKPNANDVVPPPISVPIHNVMAATKLIAELAKAHAAGTMTPQRHAAIMAEANRLMEPHEPD